MWRNNKLDIRKKYSFYYIINQKFTFIIFSPSLIIILHHGTHKKHKDIVSVWYKIRKSIFNIKVKGLYIVSIDIFLLTFRVGDSQLSSVSVMIRLLLNASRLILYELGGPQYYRHNITLTSRIKVCVDIKSIFYNQTIHSMDV